MQLQESSPDALASFSDFLLERFGLVPSMQVSFVTSVALHLFVVIGLGVKFIDMRQWDAPHNQLDVVLVNSKSATRPAKADALAQANLDGGGNTDEKLRAATPLPSLKEREQQEQLQQARLKQLEREAKELMTQLKSSTAVAQTPAPTPEAKGNDQARDLVEKSLEIARLEAQIRREMQAYQERPKKKFIGARTAEYRFAVYVDNWRTKIERIGNLNYPEEAKRNRIYGSLQLTVGIRPDGEVESVEINKSSRNKVLDQAAIRIVRLAAPFERFPDNIRADTDILYITRTWTFSRDHVQAE